MKIVIQCASSKQHQAGTLSSADGIPVRFCAEPSRAPADGLYMRPDDPADSSGVTWRDKLVAYNNQFKSNGRNLLRLASAGTLYTPSAYAALQEAVPDFFILSAGWGLVRSTYLLPDYDITFSKSREVPLQNRRSARQGGWKDFNHLASDVSSDEEVHFFGSKEYLALFCALAEPGKRVGKIVIHHNGPVARQLGCSYRQYEGNARTNWHYLALKDFLARQIGA